VQDFDNKLQIPIYLILKQSSCVNDMIKNQPLLFTMYVLTTP